MPRPPRFTCPHAVHHVTLRCNNRERLSEAASFELFVWLLQETRRRSPLSLFHYCLMANRARGRVGHLWQGRFRSTLVEQDTYFLRCMTYVDLNPVRAGIVATPAEYPWSGHAALRADRCKGPGTLPALPAAHDHASLQISPDLWKQFSSIRVAAGSSDPCGAPRRRSCRT